MARKRPPQHRADIEGIFIPRSDESFDKDRHERELAKLKDEGLDIHQHPIERYYAGKTRYDLDAPDTLFGQTVCARDYFDSSKNPEKWTLRRLDWAQWHKVASLIAADDFDQGQLLAARYGVKSIENSPITLKGAEAGCLTHEDMQKIHDAEIGLLAGLGFAVWKYSEPLRESEKKGA